MSDMNIVNTNPGVGNTSTVESASTDMEDVNPYVAHEVEMAGYAFQDRIDDLDRQINSSETDPDVKIELREEKIRLEGSFEEFKEQVSELTSTQTGLVGVARNEQMAEELAGVVHDFRQLVAESYANHGTQDVPASICATATSAPIEPKFGAVKLDINEAKLNAMEAAEKHGPALRAALSDGTDSPSSTDRTDSSSGASEPSASSGSTGGSGEIDPTNPGQMMELFAQDQDAFYDALMELDAEDRMQMLSAAQTELQQMNQLFSMMSQFSQAMHDTAKAAINNMRV